MAGLAVTDRDGVYGMPKAYRAARGLDGFKLIVGAELTMSEGPALTLLARDRAAYGVLCRAITAAHAGRPKGEARLEWAEFARHMDLPGARGLLALVDGAAGTRCDELFEMFGRERLLFGLSRLFDGRDRERTQRVLSLRARFGARVVATNDVHYHVAERRALQDVLSAIREGVSLDDAGHRLFSNAERYLKSPSFMARVFADLPEALSATLDVADSCTFSPSELRYQYPSEWIPAGETSQSYLVCLVREGSLRRYDGRVPASVVTQIKHELGLIEQLGYADYFLTIWEIVEFARSRGILCQGRGSAANSVVCYCLGVTAVDPVRMNLLFERFISVERGEPPDIDVDFEHERREEVIQHIYEKYGRDRAAMVAAVITYRSRLATREVGKVLKDEALAAKLADELYGFPRHLSIHSGGFTLSRDPIIETVPVEPARMEGRTIVQWDKDDLDAIGLLKVDVLSLGMLTAIQKTCKLVGRDFVSIPSEDRATYDMMCQADTIGTFQIESRAQINMLGRLQPRTFYDLVVQVALVRPGPIVGKMVHPYLKRRRGLEPEEYHDPRLVPILKKTLGVPIFQEQVMKIAIVMAGFSPGEADELRRAIGAWRSSGSIEKIGARLKVGLLASGLPGEWVDRLFEQIKGFSEYGFPESHAASFALIAYASAYLKCHHPAEFTCGLLNSQPMGFYSPHSLIDDAKRHDVRVLALHPNHSNWDCEIDDGALRVGWRVVRGIRRADVEALLREREVRPFESLADFLGRVKFGPVVLQRLAMGDAFACFGVDQRHALWQILAHSRQMDLFASVGDPSQQLGLFDGLDDYVAIRSEYKSYGLSTRDHPMEVLRSRQSRLPRVTTQAVKRLKHGTVASVAGLVIVRQRPPTAGGVMFSALEDETGFLDLILHKDIQEKYDELIHTHSFLVAKGVIQRDRNSASLLVKSLRPIYRDEDESAPVESELKRVVVPSLRISTEAL